jgi:serine phosphatase RsbU (regulator of sigma subunit)/CheY-like chemotaxis protein
MPTKQVLVISDTERPPQPLAEALNDLGYEVTVETDPRAVFAYPDIRRLDMVLAMVHPEDPMSWNILQLLGELVASTHVPMVVMGNNLGVEQRVHAFKLGARDCLPLELPPEELRVRLSVLAATKERFDNIIDQNVKTILVARKLRKDANRVDEEMRLARRLQMDFLPREMPDVGRARFAARLYPVGWVAGDFYDVFRLDEKHVGFYIADAIGHGVPAALLTIFVKHSMQTKRIGRESYELVSPDEALSQLNAELISADLNQSPFISMIYAIVNTATGEMTYSRAGHPRPLVLRGQEPVTELPGEGPLLGVFDGAEFDRAEYRIEPGERVLLYTDGVERCRTADADGMAAFFEVAAKTNNTSPDAYLQSLLDIVLQPRDDQPIHDDVTLVAMELGAD